MKATKFIEANSHWESSGADSEAWDIEIVPISVAHEAVKMALAEFIEEIEQYDSFARIFAALRDKKNALKIKSK